MDLLITKKANVKAKDTSGRSPVYLAAASGHLESVKYVEVTSSNMVANLVTGFFLHAGLILLQQPVQAILLYMLQLDMPPYIQDLRKLSR